MAWAVLSRVFLSCEIRGGEILETRGGHVLGAECRRPWDFVLDIHMWRDR